MKGFLRFSADMQAANVVAINATDLNFVDSIIIEVAVTFKASEVVASENLTDGTTDYCQVRCLVMDLADCPCSYSEL